MIRVVMPSLREVMEATVGLEKDTMALYARFSKLFARDPKLQEFWFSMARDEALHVGALDLVSTVLDFEGVLDRHSPISLEDATIVRLRELLQRSSREAAGNISID